MKANSLQLGIDKAYRYLSKRLFGLALALFLCLSLLLGAAGSLQSVQAAVYSYTNTVSYNVPDGTASGSGCEYWPATRYFLVNDNFTVNDLNVEFSQSHANRGQIKMTLKAPDGTIQTLIANSGDTYDNYYITLDADTGGALNDGNNDTIGGTRRNVLQTNLTAFEGKNAHGHWTMTICDNTFNATGTSQLFNAATLVFDGTAVTPVPKNHKQGPAITETYFLPWPEDEIWTAMGSIFPTSCSNYAAFRDNYDAAPRQPMVSYTGITIVDAGTVITYDHWEGGYEVDLSYPSQSSTEVWGDGDPTNGVAPGDADDYLTNGQILILDSVMLSSTLGTVVDYDARDKIGASSPIGVTRSVWSDGSQTLFAAADEVYPVDRWGTQYYAPVGDDKNLNGMFDYSGLNIIAAYDGTTIDIDKDGNGTYETTGVALSQGQSYPIYDTGTGVSTGAGIRSNSGHPIQVNQITGNICAGYESRTYPLLPFDQWDSSFYLPVSTVTDNSGAGNDDAPTTVHIYNPNTSQIYVAYEYDSGYAGYVAVPATDNSYMVMPVGKAAHFYTVTAPPTTTTNNVRDTFNDAAYNHQNGSVNWATNWTETGDDNSPTAGTIYINTIDDELRFREDSAAGDAIERSANLTGYTSATLSFELDGSNIDASPDDDIKVQIWDDANSVWVDLQTYSSGNDPGGSAVSFDISAYISSNTIVRFIMVGDLETGWNDGERWDIDDVDITFSFTSPITPSTSTFYAVASVDSDVGGTDPNRNDTYDWGITLVSGVRMSQWVIVGWAPGDDPTFQGTLVENTAPIWLTGAHPAGSATPSAAFDICVDYNGDCTSGTCTLDPISGRYYDRKVTGIAPLTQVKIYKNKIVPPDTGSGTANDDQTGTSIWVCGPVSGAKDETISDAVITAAWGADPLVAAPGKPGLDMGYTVRNQRAWTATKSAALQVDLNSNGLYDVGDTVRYTIIVRNTGATLIPTVVVTDTFPPNMSYVANSTYLINDGTPPPDSGPIADGPITPFPLDDSGSGYTYDNFDRYSAFSIRFDAIILPTEPFEDTRTNIAHITVGSQTLNPEVTIPINESEEFGTIGNYVWLDEDGDGDQDAGEAGIPNALVTITNGTDTYTTYTDASGGYLFTDLPAGTWTVTVTPPAGLVPTYDENGIGTPNVTVVNLTAGAEHLTADFGYNWTTPADTNDPDQDATGAIGDRVWVDVDGDGVQDPEEVGIQDVEVRLYTAGPDGILGTPDDLLVATDTTDANGNYIFDELDPNAYRVEVIPPAGYAQTGDPDGVSDHQTTIILAPGDVYVNADFGYQPTMAEVGIIGDTVWLDANWDGTLNSNGGEEYGIPGVTVSLIKDLNGDGVWDPGEPIIATTTTDINGNYEFTGLPVGEDYLVWVNDTHNVLDDLVPTYDANGTGTPNLSAVQDLTTAGDLDQDFGYAPPKPNNFPGVIGDTVFLDLNGDGLWNEGEGLEGVTVKLFAADGVTLVATTITDENGLYYFGDLQVDRTYIVQVQTGTLPYPGLTNTVDPDDASPGDSFSTVTLTTADPINLAQDFGYADLTLPNTIGGTIWNDLDADGYLDDEETGRYENVSVVLRDANGDIVATTVTDENGYYMFTGLPDGTYSVDVIDTYNILNGTWHSTGGTPGADNNSQNDPYTVSVSGGETNTTGDFGYFIEPAALGNFVWDDTDMDGVQDPGEPGIAGVRVSLTITYPNGESTTVSTTTDANGLYLFSSLLQDEDLDGSLGTYTLTVSNPGWTPTIPNLGVDDALDSDGIAVSANVVSVVVGSGPNLTSLIRGFTNTDYDFGWISNPTSSELSFWAVDHLDGILLQWETYNERNMLGFYLYRGLSEEFELSEKITDEFQADNPGFTQGGYYEFMDTAVERGVRYYYWLEVHQVEPTGGSIYGAVSIQFNWKLFLPITVK